jgi:3-hydroxyisobutyrate dehydrogenase-like beta-hydroxyacid dehydrogenase
MGAILVVGLGVMGGTIARRLRDLDRPVLGFDLDAGARERAAADGIEAVPALTAEVAERVDLVVSSLPTDVAVTATFAAADGFGALLRPGTALVETSTIAPATVIGVADALEPRGVHVVDAPVSGGPAEAAEGALVVLCAGTDAAVEAARDVLAHLGTPRRLGAVGQGKTLKLVNNLMGLANLAVAAEAFTIGVRAGVDPQVLFDTLAGSGGRSHHFLKRFPHVLERDFAARWSIAIGSKDLHTALGLAADVGAASPLGELVTSLYDRAAEQGLGGEDVAAVIKLFEEA